MHCQHRGEIIWEQLPTCNDVLELQVMRVNFQVQIWRESLVQFKTEVNPEENHGWTLDDNNNKTRH